MKVIHANYTHSHTHTRIVHTSSFVIYLFTQQTSSSITLIDQTKKKKKLNRFDIIFLFLLFLLLFDSRVTLRNEGENEKINPAAKVLYIIMKQKPKTQMS